MRGTDLFPAVKELTAVSRPTDEIQTDLQMRREGKGVLVQYSSAVS